MAAIGKAILIDYDLITLDIRMPGVSGLEALSVIRGLRVHAVVAIISAYVRNLDPEAAGRADVIFAKPVSLERFREVLKLTEEIKQRRQALRELGQTLGG